MTHRTSSAEIHPGQALCGSKYDDWADSVTRPVAENHKQPWRDFELAILQDASEGRQGTPLDTALLLGRTYSATVEQARRLGWAGTHRSPSWAPYDDVRVVDLR